MRSPASSRATSPCCRRSGCSRRRSRRTIAPSPDPGSTGTPHGSARSRAETRGSALRPTQQPYELPEGDHRSPGRADMTRRGTPCPDARKTSRARPVRPPAAASRDRFGGWSPAHSTPAIGRSLWPSERRPCRVPEGVYQVFMSQMAPRGLLTSLPGAAGRLWQSWRQLVLPQLLSLADFRKLPDRRTIRLRSL